MMSHLVRAFVLQIEARFPGNRALGCLFLQKVTMATLEGFQRVTPGDGGAPSAG